MEMMAEGEKFTRRPAQRHELQTSGGRLTRSMPAPHQKIHRHFNAPGMTRKSRRSRDAPDALTGQRGSGCGERGRLEARRVPCSRDGFGERCSWIPRTIHPGGRPPCKRRVSISCGLFARMVGPPRKTGVPAWSCRSAPFLLKEAPASQVICGRTIPRRA